MKPADKQKKGIPAATKPKSGNATSTRSVRFGAIVWNVSLAVVAIVFLNIFFQHNEPNPADPGETHINSGYDWLLNTMLKNNLETISNNPDKTLQQKYELKWGPGEIKYVDSIRRKTPEASIVMLPPKSLIQGIGFKSVVDLPWITYFLYPRKVVYGDSIRDPLYDKADYIVAINGWGLDKLKYQVEKPEQFMILPINKQ